MTDIAPVPDDTAVDPTQPVFDATAAAGQLFTMLSQQVSSGAMPMDVGSMFGAQKSDQAPDFTNLLSKYETVPLMYPDGTEEDVLLSSPGTKAMSQKAMAWGGYQNGRIPKTAMVKVAGGHYLEPAAAARFQQMVAAAAADGVKIGLSDSYRSYDEQVSVRARRGGQVATALPGRSIHGWGRALDVSGQAAQNWMRNNGARFGWYWPTWAQRQGKSYEPWHFEFYGGK